MSPHSSRKQSAAPGQGGSPWDTNQPAGRQQPGGRAAPQRVGRPRAEHLGPRVGRLAVSRAQAVMFPTNGASRLTEACCLPGVHSHPGSLCGGGREPVAAGHHATWRSGLGVTGLRRNRERGTGPPGTDLPTPAHCKITGGPGAPGSSNSSSAPHNIRPPSKSSAPLHRLGRSSTKLFVHSPHPHSTLQAQVPCPAPRGRQSWLRPSWHLPPVSVSQRVAVARPWRPSRPVRV